MQYTAQRIFTKSDKQHPSQGAEREPGKPDAHNPDIKGPVVYDCMYTKYPEQVYLERQKLYWWLLRDMDRVIA